jgi:hypothetical protein
MVPICGCVLPVHGQSTKICASHPFWPSHKLGSRIFSTPFLFLLVPVFFGIMPPFSATNPMAGFLACSCYPQTEPRKFCIVFVKQVSIILCGESLAHSRHKYNSYSSILLPQKRRTHVKYDTILFIFLNCPPLFLGTIYQFFCLNSSTGFVVIRYGSLLQQSAFFNIEGTTTFFSCS